MEKGKPLAADVLKQVIPPLAAWALTKILERPRVKAVLHRVDRVAESKVKRARRNAVANRAWIAAGAVVFVVGVGLLANATRKK